MKAAQLALMEMERDMSKAHFDARIPWTPDARKTQKEMRDAARSAIRKLSEVTGLPTELPDTNGHDVNDYLTKPS